MFWYDLKVSEHLWVLAWNEPNEQKWSMNLGWSWAMFICEPEPDPWASA